MGDELRQELPNAGITNEVTSIVDGEERPSEAEADELREEARVVLARIDSVRATLDEALDRLRTRLRELLEEDGDVEIRFE